MWAKLYVQIALEGEFMAKTRLYLLLTLSRAGFKEFGDVDLGTYTLGIIACHKNRSGSLAKEETLPRTRRCNKLHSAIYAVLLSDFASRRVWLQHFVRWPGNPSLWETSPIWGYSEASRLGFSRGEKAPRTSGKIPVLHAGIFQVSWVVDGGRGLSAQVRRFSPCGVEEGAWSTPW